MIKVGDKVVCINDSWYNLNHKEVSDDCYDPREGEIYTVDGIVEQDNNLYFSFKEIQIIGSDGEREHYDGDCFRKVVPHNFRNSITEKLANKPLIKEGIEIIIVEPELV